MARLALATRKAFLTNATGDLVNVRVVFIYHISTHIFEII